MKYSYIKKAALFVVCASLLGACKKSWLEASPKGTDLESNYYKDPTEAFNGLVAAYQPLAFETVNNRYASRSALLSVPSDECYAGGGSSSDIPYWQTWSNFTVTDALGPEDLFWGRSYTGIYRSNLLLTKISNVPGLNAATQKRYTAECKFLRAYYYFDLYRLFKSVPLFTAPVPVDQAYTQKQASREDVMAQIEKDLNEAIPDLPVTVPVATEGGRITQGAAKALLGKAILWQNNNSRMLEAANLFEDINKTGNAYGYSLLPNFGDIFKMDNKFNNESVFEIVHTAQGLSSWSNFGGINGNVACQLVGARSYSGPTYADGYGFCPVTTQLVDAMKNDPRYPYTIVNIDSLSKKGVCSYSPGYNNTGYFIVKYAPLQANKSSKGGDVPLNYANDYIEIRLADTYLMEAEALVRGDGDVSKAQQYLDAVRARVGLPSVPATLDNIYNERRLELATEGHRFFDLVRTGQAASVLAFKGFTANKNEFLPIPLTEINNSILVQDPAYK